MSYFIEVKNRLGYPIKLNIDEVYLITRHDKEVGIVNISTIILGKLVSIPLNETFSDIKKLAPPRFIELIDLEDRKLLLNSDKIWFMEGNTKLVGCSAITCAAVVGDKLFSVGLKMTVESIMQQINNMGLKIISKDL